MSVDSAERAKNGYLLGKGEGEAHWLLGMLEVVKISGADTNGEFGLLEVTVRASEGSPWHVHPDEDESFYCSTGVHRLLRRATTLAPSGLLRLRTQGGAPHLHRRDGRGKGLDRVPAIPLRGFLREVGEPATERVLPPPLEGPPDMGG